MLCLTASVWVGTTAAYLSKSPGKAENVLTVGQVTVGLEEENWDGEKNPPLHPGETVSKDPTVKNTGKNDVQVFLQVDVPMENIRLTDNVTKMKTERKMQEIFFFEADKEKWELISRQEENQSCRYIYGYRSVLRPGEKTVPLFTEIRAADYLEGELDREKRFVLQVSAQGIQSGTKGKGLSEIYQEFLQQTVSDGKGERA